MKTILKQIRNEWRGNAFLFVELLLVFVVLWYIVDWTLVTARVYNAPMGFDTEHCYNITYSKLTPKSALYNPDLTTEDDIENLLELVDRLRHRPGVEAAALSQNCYPYNEGSNGMDLKVDSTTLRTHLLWVEPEFFHVFRYGVTDKTTADKMGEALRDNQVVISSTIAADYPELQMKDATALLGKEVILLNFGEDARRRVGAVGSPVRWSHFYTTGQWGGDFIALHLDKDRIQRYDDVRYLNLSIRVTPEEDRDFISRLMDDADRLYRVGNLYLLNVTSFKDLRANSELEDMNEVKTQLCVLGFLMLNIFLGVIGTFWFRTQQRRQEVALRMALGSSRNDVFFRLMCEGVFLLTLATIPAVVIAFNVGIAELIDVDKMPFDALRFFSGIVLTWILMALMIVAGIWYPARGAMKVQPAEALHDE